MFNNTSDNRPVNLADMFSSIAGQLGQDRAQINGLDGGNGNHGDNMQYNFQMIANALQGMNGSNLSAADQLRSAADMLEQQGRGATAPLYAEGLRDASMNVQGQDGISLNDLAPFLTGLLSGVQRRTNARPGQGTLLDTLLPAVTGFMNARNAGNNGIGAITQALSSALTGSQQQYQNTPAYGQTGRTAQGAWQDPGASSARSVLEGLFRSFTG